VVMVGIAVASTDEVFKLSVRSQAAKDEVPMRKPSLGWWEVVDGRRRC
jgi:hypothetical protein